MRRASPARAASASARLSVVSATHTYDDIIERVEAFLADFLTTLKKMPREEYVGNVKSAVANRLLADKSIGEEAVRYWFDIDMRRYEFERAEKEAAAMRDVKQKDLVKWLEANLLTPKKAKRLSVVVTPPPPEQQKEKKGTSDTKALKAVKGVTRVDDGAAYAQSLPPHDRIVAEAPSLK